MAIVGGLINGVARTVFPGPPSDFMWIPHLSAIASLVGAVVGIASLWICVALDIKRCHDRDKPGWWLLIFYFIPVIGWVWGLIELGFLDGAPGSNKYGESPKATGAA